MSYPDLTHAPFTTIRDLLRYAVSHFQAAQLFFGHGNQHAFDEAAYLILHTLHLPPDHLETYLDAKLHPTEITTILHIIEQRIQHRMPAAYLTREAWLGDYSFFVDERVIVPRSFIAECIPTHFSPWIADPDTVTSVLELCTGSGCLAIMLADTFIHAQVDAVDISLDALAVAEDNIKRYHLEHRIQLIQSNIYETLPHKQYQMIVTNPPYVNSQSMANLPPEYRHEPAIALDGGSDGMDIIKTIIQHAKRYLEPRGILIIEVGHERLALEKTFPTLPFTWLTTSSGDDMVCLITAEQLP